MSAVNPWQDVSRYPGGMSGKLSQAFIAATPVCKYPPLTLPSMYRSNEEPGFAVIVIPTVGGPPAVEFGEVFEAPSRIDAFAKENPRA